MTHRQAHALAGEWYVWFVRRHEDEPGTEEQWDLTADHLRDASDQFHRENDGDDRPPSPAERRAVHHALTSLGNVEAFLHERGMVLTEEAKGLFLDVVEPEFAAAIRLLRRRAGGDYAKDKRPERFAALDLPKTPAPSAVPSGLSAAARLTCWAAFELWIEGRRPAPATINRWRAVFVDLKGTFGDRDAATITADEAQAWVDGLLASPDRSPHVVEEVWRRAAKVVFAWAVKRKRLTSNPFAEATVALPKRPPKLREREFTENEWRAILTATLQPPPARMEPHNAAARRWVPWVCAYTGARPGEVCQLRAEDVVETPAGWAIRITPEAGTVKTGEARTVPLHEHLIAQGFSTFAKANGAGPLLYDPSARRKTDDDATNPVRAPWAKSVNKLSDWVRSLGVKDEGISPSHAWRHTFKRRAARAGIERRIRFAMCGHVSGDEGDKYETPTLEDLAEAMRAFPRYEL